jgi:hypothetical protein
MSSLICDLAFADQIAAANTKCGFLAVFSKLPFPLRELRILNPSRRKNSSWKMSREHPEVPSILRFESMLRSDFAFSAGWLVRQSSDFDNYATQERRGKPLRENTEGRQTY